MKCYSFALFLLLFAVPAGVADVFRINGRDIVVPNPDGFVRVTDDMVTLKEVFGRIQDPWNDTLAIYIPEADAPSARKGQFPDMARWLVLKVNKKTRNITVGRNDFAKLKETVKSQNRKMFEELKSELPGLMEKLSEGVSRDFGADFSMKIAQVIPLDPHYETEGAVGFSMFSNNEVRLGSQHEKSVVSGTSTLLNASGTILLLNVFGPQNQLEWTRSTSANWTDSVMAVNGRAPRQTSDGRGIDWGEVFRKGLVGAAIGGLIALVNKVVSYFKNKNRVEG